MNQVEDRKALVDFLEDALVQAEIAHTAKGTQEKLDRELKQALLEYEQALALEQPGTPPVTSQSVAEPESAETAQFSPQLLTSREPWYRALLDNARSVVGMTGSRLLKDFSPPRRNRPID